MDKIILKNLKVCKSMPFENFIQTKQDWIGDNSFWVIGVDGILREEWEALNR
ncbi:MAG TPA: hypothetical protein VIH12_05460 [Solibacillus sp.]